MNRYRNLGGNSAVSHYYINIDSITVKFSGTTRSYTYSYRRAGRNHVEKMKILAVQGRGLNSYINRNVKSLYD